MIEHDQLWEKCLGEIEIEVSKPNFSTWFKNTSLIKEEEGIYFVGVPNEFVKDWLFKKYHKLIIKTIRNYSENIRNIEYLIIKMESRISSSSSEKGLLGHIEQKNELPLHDLYINKEDNLNPKYVFDSFIVGS